MKCSCGSNEYELRTQKGVFCVECGRIASLGVTISQIKFVDGVHISDMKDED